MRKNVNNDVSKDLPIALGMRALFKDWYNFGNFQVIWKYAMFKWQIYDVSAVEIIQVQIYSTTQK